MGKTVKLYHRDCDLKKGGNKMVQFFIISLLIAFVVAYLTELLMNYIESKATDASELEEEMYDER